jgi:hypothetical protein
VPRVQTLDKGLRALEAARELGNRHNVRRMEATVSFMSHVTPKDTLTRYTTAILFLLFFEWVFYFEPEEPKGE